MYVHGAWLICARAPAALGGGGAPSGEGLSRTRRGFAGLPGGQTMATTTVHHFSPLATAAPARELLRQLWDRVSARPGGAPSATSAATSRSAGGKFTDSLERDVERRFLFGGWPSASSSGRG